MRKLKVTYEVYVCLLEEKLELNYKRFDALAEISDLNNTLRLRKNRKNYEGIPFPKEEEEEIRQVLEWLKDEVRWLDAQLALANTRLQALAVISPETMFMEVARRELSGYDFQLVEAKARAEFEKWSFARLYLKFRPAQDEYMGMQEKISLKESM